MLKELHTIQRIRTPENEASIITLQKCAAQLCVEVKHGLGFRSTKSSTFMVIIWLLPQTLVHALLSPLSSLLSVTDTENTMNLEKN
jgi:hypothetical protein